MRFVPVTLDDAGWIREAVARGGELGCEYCFGNIFLWSDIYDTRICRRGGFLVSFEGTKRPSLLFPVGRGSDEEFSALVSRLSDSWPALAGGAPFSMHRIPEAGRERLERLFPGRFEFFAEPDDYDYIYLRSELAELAGKKFHSKRNHISRFLRDFPGYSYEPVGAGNLCDCLHIARSWSAARREEGEHSADGYNSAKIELEVVKAALHHFFELEFSGGLLRTADGTPCAFTLGESIGNGCFVTHFEKAAPGFEAAYAVINRDFAKHSLSGFTLVNREEDMGIEGLRKAKMSYHPHILYKKYRARACR